MSAIPTWNAEGLIPPITSDPTSPTRSPYKVSLTDVILRFNTSDARKAVLHGLLRFRSELHKIGLVKGLQWLNGSFLEDIETTELRDPRDIDVVTFYRLPPNVHTEEDLVPLNTGLFNHAQVKDEYLVDNYFVLITTDPSRLIQQSAYWYSMWSHRRGGVWKGFVQVDLDPTHDQTALQLLSGSFIEGSAL